MTWNATCSAEIAEMFAALEGCSDENDRRVLTLVVTDETSPERAAFRSAYRKQPHVMAKRRAYENTKAHRERKNRRRRAQTLKKNLEMWAGEAKLICIGREVPIEHWLLAMSNPVGREELDAQADFIFFLKNCRGLSAGWIAKQLGITKDRVTEALKSRGAL